MNPRTDRALPGATLAGLALILAWEASGLDLALARASGGLAGFPLRNDWWLGAVLHEGGRRAAWAFEVLLCLGVWWPVGPLRRIDRARRVQLALAAPLSVLLVAALKGASQASCPWDASVFGGVARYAPHWAGFVSTDGGPGHCFPAGHAASGFAFVGGWFALRERAPALARGWLAVACAAGVLFGAAQQWRGAHFASHTLWTAWLCWCVAWGADLGRRAWQDRRGAKAAA
jgi:membrane-associated PAP2 superfamily phosphatase